MKQHDADLLRPAQSFPDGLNLKTLLGVIPNWRLFDIATCFGLWRTEGMSKYELTTALSEHPMVTPRGMWSVMTSSERGAATKLAPVGMIEVKDATRTNPTVLKAKPYQFPRAVLDLIENAVFGGGRLRHSQVEQDPAPKEQGAWRTMTRPIVSILILLDVGRVAELSDSFGISGSQPLTVAVELERKKVSSRDLLHKLTTDELRLVAAAWTVSAPREDLIGGLEGAMDSFTETSTPAASSPNGNGRLKDGLS